MKVYSFVLLGLVFFSGSANAQCAYLSGAYGASCTTTTQVAGLFSNGKDYGNYYCSFCANLDLSRYDEGLIFIKDIVNKDVQQWKLKDTVTVTNGKNWVKYKFEPAAPGQFIPKEAGDGIGPGDPKNHDGEGNPINNDSSNSSTTGYSYGSTYFVADYYTAYGEHLNSLYNASLYSCNLCRQGTVTIKEL